jgi:hypothetical protein
MILGFDGQRKEYVGTWFDSMHSGFRHYEGTVDAAAQTLVLAAEGPTSGASAKTVIELKSRDHKILTSSMQGDDGRWVAFLTINSRRK